jgi:hypothetical protein
MTCHFYLGTKRELLHLNYLMQITKPRPKRERDARWSDRRQPLASLASDTLVLAAPEPAINILKLGKGYVGSGMPSAVVSQEIVGSAIGVDPPRSRSIPCSTDCLQSTDCNQFVGASRSRRPIIGDWPDLDCGSTLKTSCCGPNATL